MKGLAEALAEFSKDVHIFHLHMFMSEERKSKEKFTGGCKVDTNINTMIIRKLRNRGLGKVLGYFPGT